MIVTRGYGLGSYKSPIVTGGIGRKASGIIIVNIIASILANSSLIANINAIASVSSTATGQGSLITTILGIAVIISGMLGSSNVLSNINAIGSLIANYGGSSSVLAYLTVAGVIIIEAVATIGGQAIMFPILSALADMLGFIVSHSSIFGNLSTGKEAYLIKAFILRIAREIEVKLES